MAREVELPLFRGPLELLLQLIERRELDITAISLVAVTEQYLEILHRGQGIDLDALADFIVVAAKLLYLKGRSLLPQPHPSPEGPEAADLDSVAGGEMGQELVEQLLEYRRFREAAQELRRLEEQGQRAYPRLAPPLSRGPSGLGLSGVTLDGLLHLLRQALERHQPLPVAAVPPQQWRLQDKIAQLGEEIALHRRLSFRGVLERCQSRVEIVVTFLALLELIKREQAQVEQEEPFGDIAILAAGTA